MNREEAKAIITKKKNCNNTNIEHCMDRESCAGCENEHSELLFYEAMDVAIEALGTWEDVK